MAAAIAEKEQASVISIGVVEEDSSGYPDCRSEYIKSDIDGDAVVDGKRTSEYVTYTQVDFSLIGRPNTFTSAKAIFRMHADWPNFWGSPQNPPFQVWYRRV